MKNQFRSALTLGVAAALMLGGTVTANAAGRPAVVGQSSSIQSAAGNALVAPQVQLTKSQRLEVEIIQRLVVGQSHTLQGSSLTVTKTTNGFTTNLSSTEAASTRASFCGIALATALIGIGAGALGVLAAVTGGGSVIIAGVALSGAQLGVLAGVATSYTALLGWISLYIC